MMFKLFVLFAVAICTFAAHPPAGKPQMDERIVGGHSVDIRDYGWQVSLQRYARHACGGAIVNDHWVVTAAHCVYEYDLHSFSVRVGSNEHDHSGSERRVTQIIIHPNYEYASYDYDVAVVIVDKPFDMNGNNVRAVSLTNSGSNSPVGSLGTVTGWGHLGESGSAASDLQGVDVPIVDQKICSQKFSSEGNITARMMCAGFEQGGKDACQGDSGGPLVDQSNKLIGIVSWGVGCGSKDFPGVYTRVSYPSIRDFIKQHTGM